MAYELTADLLTGNKTIDDQHRQLIQAINDLLAACSTGKGRTEIEKTTKFLQDYTTKHFSEEEMLQRMSGYPDFTNHRMYHEGFKKVVAGLVKELNDQGPNIVLVGKVNNSIAGWLLNHIKREDKKVAEHIRTKG